MSGKKKAKKVSPFFVILVLAVIAISFIIGTFVGFKQGVQAGVQLKVLSGCTVVDCETLGVDAAVCEVCVEEDESIVTKLLVG